MRFNSRTRLALLGTLAVVATLPRATEARASGPERGRCHAPLSVHLDGRSYGGESSGWQPEEFIHGFFSVTTSSRRGCLLRGFPDVALRSSRPGRRARASDDRRWPQRPTLVQRGHPAFFTLTVGYYYFYYRDAPHCPARPAVVRLPGVGRTFHTTFSARNGCDLTVRPIHRYAYGTRHCRSAALRGNRYGGSAGLNNADYSFQIRNRSRSACHVTGPARLRLFGRDGRALETDVGPPLEDGAPPIVLLPRAVMTLSASAGGDGDPDRCVDDVQIGIAPGESTRFVRFAQRRSFCLPVNFYVRSFFGPIG